MSRKIDLTGQKFGQLTVLEESGQDKQGHLNWLCKCECGNSKALRGSDLRRGHAKSCGCLRAKHGMTGTRFYKIWDNMKERTSNPNAHNYGNYGGRGIILCPRWRKFENFRDDMLESYETHVEEHGEARTSIERTNNDTRYTPFNCRFATPKEQANNRRPRISKVAEHRVPIQPEMPEVIAP